MRLNHILEPVARKLSKLWTRPTAAIKKFAAPPEEPLEYAHVGAPVVPKSPTLSAKAVAVPERYEIN